MIKTDPTMLVYDATPGPWTTADRYDLRHNPCGMDHDAEARNMVKGYPYYRPDIQYSLHPYDMFIQPDRIPYNDLFGLILKYLGLRVDRQETVKHRLVKDDNDKNLSE